jgi:hypothetical protein
MVKVCVIVKNYNYYDTKYFRCPCSRQKVQACKITHAYVHAQVQVFYEYSQTSHSYKHTYSHM